MSPGTPAFPSMESARWRPERKAKRSFPARSAAASGVVAQFGNASAQANSGRCRCSRKRGPGRSSNSWRLWHFQAFARDPAASVFYTKTPHFLLHVDELARHFPNARFLFMVRNPYAVCEGICRNQLRKAVRFSGDLPSPRAPSRPCASPPQGLRRQRARQAEGAK